eukprot:2176647-Lingulodinium_polyedra.AAC.1
MCIRDRAWAKSPVARRRQGLRSSSAPTTTPPIATAAGRARPPGVEHAANQQRQLATVIEPE